MKPHKNKGRRLCPTRMIRIGQIICHLLYSAIQEYEYVADAESSIPPLHFNPRMQYVAVEHAYSTTSGGDNTDTASDVHKLHNAMGELSDALSDTRRILDGEQQIDDDIMVVETNGSETNVIHDSEFNPANNNNKEGSSTNNNNLEPSIIFARQSFHSRNWWERLYQGGPLYDETTGKLIEETADSNGDTSTRPANRRSHSATVYKATNAELGTENEYMIISGGFTDEDWNTFPVWAYDMSNSQSISDIESIVRGDTMMMGVFDGDPADKVDEEKVEKIELSSRPWIDLTKLTGEDGTEKDVPFSSSDSSDAPQGRVGHLSSIHNDCLYIFGGLTYRLGSFHVDITEGDDSEKNKASYLAIWKACGLDKLLANTGEEGLKWEKIIPKLNTRVPTQPLDTATTTDVESNDDEGNVNEEEEEEDSVSDDENDDTEDRRFLRQTSYRNDTTHIHTHNIIPQQHQKNRNEAVEPLALIVGETALPRGEAQGAHYPQTNHGNNNADSFVFYGGMHHHQTLAEALEATTILGDVWKFDYDTETLSMLAPYPPLEWQRDERNGAFPMARTAHAGTIVGDELIIHGGMHFGEENNAHDTSSFSSPSNSYATYKTSSRWQPLSDIWVFNLVTLKWKERIQYPQLARSYHSMVGGGNGTIACFGGFQQDNNIPGETVAFVFKDLILSRANDTHWQKLVPSFEEGGMSHWMASSEYAHPGITNRLEHSAVLDQYGSMYIWGGRFQTVSQIVGLWRLDVFNEDANLKYEIAPPDGIEQYEAELQALHMFIATMMFMTLTISSLFSMMRRQAAEGGGGGGGSGISLSRGGLSRQTIDSLPLKRYTAPRSEVTEDGDVVEDVSLSRENSRDETSSGLEDADCCPICLVEYEDGVSEIRTLPCGHIFDRECIDSWLTEHTTCPSCREVIPNPVIEDYETDPRWQFISAFESTRRRHPHWGGAPMRFHSELVLSTDELDGTDVSSQNSSRNEETTNAQTNDHQMYSIRPSFLRIRSFFSRRGHVGFVVPGDEEVANSIELV